MTLEAIVPGKRHLPLVARSDPLRAERGTGAMSFVR